jgi:DNA modification methylase
VQARYLPPHPFPARMSPEVALEAVESDAAVGTVLDPMCGSGTVLRAAISCGRRAIGMDVDPLAVLMARVWTTPVDPEMIRVVAGRTTRQAQSLLTRRVNVPWIDEDEETAGFVRYWFAPQQRAALRRLAVVLREMNGDIANVLRLCLSRLIITKDRGASLARDVSHSRPHRVRESNDFDVLHNFVRTADAVASRLGDTLTAGHAEVRIADARKASFLRKDSVDLVVTSPPYLNAIDYMRGHRLSLVWLGWTLAQLREIRSASVGTERGDTVQSPLVRRMMSGQEDLDSLPPRFQAIVARYAADIVQVTEEVARVLRPTGRAVFVVGNSTLRGVFLDNAKLLVDAARGANLTLLDCSVRELPPSRRYLPPPRREGGSALGKRMRSESVILLQKGVAAAAEDGRRRRPPAGRP